jgi:tetratricopeptide (TPR) repeat protein
MEALSSALNNKRQLYKSTVRQMVGRVADSLTAYDYMTLGFEHQQDAEIEKAQEYYASALAVEEQDEIERVTALRYLGALFLSLTKYHDRAKGDAYYREAVEITYGKMDDYSRYTTGYTYEQWAIALAANRYPEYRRHFEAAREHYEAMHQTNQLRSTALKAFELRLARVMEGLPVPPAPVKPAEPQIATDQDRTVEGED